MIAPVDEVEDGIVGAGKLDGLGGERRRCNPEASAKNTSQYKYN